MPVAAEVQRAENNLRKRAEEHRYWVTRSSGKTHNRNCRYYGNSKGCYSEKGTGNDCKICGGAARG